MLSFIPGQQSISAFPLWFNDLGPVYSQSGYEHLKTTTKIRKKMVKGGYKHTLSARWPHWLIIHLSNNCIEGAIPTTTETSQESTFNDTLKPDTYNWFRVIFPPECVSVLYQGRKAFLSLKSPPKWRQLSPGRPYLPSLPPSRPRMSTWFCRGHSAEAQNTTSMSPKVPVTGAFNKLIPSSN